MKRGNEATFPRLFGSKWLKKPMEMFSNSHIKMPKTRQNWSWSIIKCWTIEWDMSCLAMKKRRGEASATVLAARSETSCGWFDCCYKHDPHFRLFCVISFDWSTPQLSMIEDSCKWTQKLLVSLSMFFLYVLHFFARNVISTVLVSQWGSLTGWNPGPLTQKTRQPAQEEKEHRG